MHFWIKDTARTFAIVLAVLIVVIPFLCFAGFHAGNLPSYREVQFRNLSNNDGLSQNFISVIHQDHLGLIWIGTKDGLNLFDGYTFKVFRHDPFDPGSLSGNFVRAIYSDAAGRLWIGSLEGGLNLFDRSTGDFLGFQHDPHNPNSISHNGVQAITSDGDGHIWIGMSGGGLDRISFGDQNPVSYNKSYSVTRFNDVMGGISLADEPVVHLFTDRDNHLWIGTTKRILTADLNKPGIIFREVSTYGPYQTDEPPAALSAERAGIRLIFENKSGVLWMANARGLFYYDAKTEMFQQFLPDRDIFNSGHLLSACFVTVRGMEELWVGTSESLNAISPITGEVRALLPGNEFTESLSGSGYSKLFKDSGGTIWLGGNGHGLFLHDPEATKFAYPDDTLLLSNDKYLSSRNLSVRSFYQRAGENNILWLGTNEGLFRIDRSNASMRKIGLGNESEGMVQMVFSIAGDESGTLWLGTNIGLVRYYPTSTQHKVFPSQLFDPDGSKEPRIAYVHISGNDIWTLSPNTIALFNPENESFEHVRYNSDALNRFREAVFPFIFEDGDGNFWIGSKNGLHHFDVQSRKLTSYVNDPYNPESLSYNDVRCILPDPDEPGRYLWLATGGGGVSRFDKQSKSFTRITEADGLPNNMVYGMLADVDAVLWMSTNKGLVKFDTRNNRFTGFTTADGLQSNEFNSGAFFKSGTGEMFFGGINGYNSFFPSAVRQKSYSPPVIFTALYLLKEGGENKLIRIPESGKIYLQSRQQHFSVEFSALDYFSTRNNQYAYSLEKKAEQWIHIGHNRSIIFTDMKPGTYILKVRGTNNDGIWSDQEATLHVHISRPWWMSITAYVFYLTFIVAAGAGVRRYEMSRLELMNRMRLSGLQANKFMELDQMKSRFFANISHELRTPLTLIKGPVEHLLDEADDPRNKQMLRLVHSNSKKLLLLINQLLDLSRLESRQYKIRLSKGDIIIFTKGIVRSFSALARQKQIELEFFDEFTRKKCHASGDFYYDRDVFGKVLDNLLSNAIKFTPVGGKVTIKVCLHSPRKGESLLEFFICDTGIGIPKEKLPFIYDRFFQVDDSMNRRYEGSGIGLAYVKELVDLHKGHIAAVSKPGKGTTFRIRFPVGLAVYEKEQMDDSLRDPEVLSISHGVNGIDGSIRESAHTSEPELFLDTQSGAGSSIPDVHQVLSGQDTPVVLIVEDHAGVREYIRYCLGGAYRVLEARNGQQGLIMAAETIPDLIISDVMMPGIDGFEYCARIKSDEKTSHIPLILLTARAEDRDKIRGYETGADDYLIKPFNRRELNVRIQNLIDSRRKLREKFSGKTVIKPSEISVTSRDRVFIEKALKEVEKNIGSEFYTVEDLGRQLGLSQSALNRKLKAVVNQPANQFIRSVKMHRAKELLEKDAGNIAEIAYMVGFGDPGYFTKIFKTFFGKLPSEARNTYSDRQA